MIIALNKDFYSLMKTVDFSAIKDYLRFDDSKCAVELVETEVIRKNRKGRELRSSTTNMLLDCIGDEVVSTGLSDDQEKVLPRGKELYQLYDSIYYSLPVKKT